MPLTLPFWHGLFVKFFLIGLFGRIKCKSEKCWLNKHPSLMHWTEACKTHMVGDGRRISENMFLTSRWWWWPDVHIHNNLAYRGIKNSYQPTCWGGLWSPGNVEINSKYATAMNQVFDQVSNGGSCDDLSKEPLVKRNRPLDDQVGKPRSSCTWCECVSTPPFCLHFCERPNDFDDFVRKRENLKTNKWNVM